MKAAVYYGPRDVGSAGAAMHVPGVVLGHEFAGTVRALGDDVDDVAEGLHVAVAPIEWCGECWACRQGHPNLCRRLALYGGYRLPLHGGRASLVAVSRRSVFPAPDGLGVVEAALAEPVAVAVHAVRIASIASGTSVVVLGAGPIGLGVLQAAGAALAIVSEPSAARRAVARSCGATAVLDPRSDDLIAAVRDLTGHGVDLVFDTTGVNAALDQGVERLREALRVRVVGTEQHVLDSDEVDEIRDVVLPERVHVHVAPEHLHRMLLEALRHPRVGNTSARCTWSSSSNSRRGPGSRNAGRQSIGSPLISRRLNPWVFVPHAPERTGCRARIPSGATR